MASLLLLPLQPWGYKCTIMSVIVELNTGFYAWYMSRWRACKLNVMILSTIIWCRDWISISSTPGQIEEPLGPWLRSGAYHCRTRSGRTVSVILELVAGCDPPNLETPEGHIPNSINSMIHQKSIVNVMPNVVSSPRRSILVLLQDGCMLERWVDHQSVSGARTCIRAWVDVQALGGWASGIVFLAIDQVNREWRWFSACADFLLQLRSFTATDTLP